MGPVRSLSVLLSGSRIAPLLEWLPSVKEQEAMLDTAAAAAGQLDLVGRSYAQFRCQMSQLPTWQRRVLQVLGEFVVIPGLFVAYIAGFVSRSPRGMGFARVPQTVGSDRIVFVSDARSLEALPAALADERIDVVATRYRCSFRLLRFWSTVARRFPHDPYFLVKLLAKLAQYESVLAGGGAQRILCTSEYSFTSSALTAFCHMYGAQHIDMMHGEKLFNIRDSFFAFDRCYVWDESYVQLFRRLRAADGQFVVSQPAWAERLAALGRASPPRHPVMTYYLGNEDWRHVRSVVDALACFSTAFEIVVRPHPLYGDAHQLRDLPAYVTVQLPSEVPITESILSSSHALGLYSTVLIQAHYAGRTVVIDDLDDPMTDRLRELESAAFKIADARLSELVASMHGHLASASEDPTPEPAVSDGSEQSKCKIPGELGRVCACKIAPSVSDRSKSGGIRG